MSKFNQNLQTQTNNVIAKLNKLDEKMKFSAFAREKFNEIGLSGKTKLEDVMDEIYNVAMSGDVDAEVKIKAIKTMCEMVGGGLNEKNKEENKNNNTQINLFLNNLKTIDE